MRSRLVLPGPPSIGNTEVVSVDFGRRSPVPGDLDVRWIHGSADPRTRLDPAVQVHHYDEHTVLLRQSKDLTYEAPFLFLLFGNDRALLLDTGATATARSAPWSTTLLTAWRRATARRDRPLRAGRRAHARARRPCRG